MRNWLIRVGGTAATGILLAIAGAYLKPFIGTTWTHAYAVVMGFAIAEVNTQLERRFP